MISIGRLEARERAAWEQLFAGYHAFYGRPNWPQESYTTRHSRFKQDDRIHARGARVDGRLVGIAHFLVHASTTSADVAISRTFSPRRRPAARASLAR